MMPKCSLTILLTVLIVAVPKSVLSQEQLERPLDIVIKSYRQVIEANPTTVEVILSKIDAKWNEDRTAVVYTLRGMDRNTNKPATSTGIIGWDGSRNVLVEFAVSSNGETFSSTFHVTGEEWRCPTEGTVLEQGKFKSFKSVRMFKWNPSGFEIISTENMRDREKGPDTTETLRRVQ